MTHDDAMTNEIIRDLKSRNACLEREICDLKDKLRLYETAWQQECRERRVNVTPNAAGTIDRGIVSMHAKTITDLRMEVDQLRSERDDLRAAAEELAESLIALAWQQECKERRVNVSMSADTSYAMINQFRSERDDLRAAAEELAESLIALRDDVVEHVSQTLHNSSPDTPSIASVLGLDDET